MPSRDLIVGTTEIQLAEGRPNRVVLGIQNTHNTATIKFTDVKGNSGEGHRVFKESAIYLHRTDGDTPEKGHFVISDTVGTVVNIMETYGKPAKPSIAQPSIYAKPLEELPEALCPSLKRY